MDSSHPVAIYYLPGGATNLYISLMGGLVMEMQEMPLTNPQDLLKSKDSLKSLEHLKKSRIDILKVFNSAIDHLLDICCKLTVPRSIAYMRYPINMLNSLESCAEYILKLRELYDGMTGEDREYCYERKMSSMLASAALELHCIAETDFYSVFRLNFVNDYIASSFVFHSQHGISGIKHDTIVGYNAIDTVAFVLADLRHYLYNDIFNWENVHASLSAMLSEEK